MRRMLFHLIVLAAVAVSTPVARELTLPQALQLAREHSNLVKQAEAEQAAATEALGSARASRLPTLEAAATASYADEIASLDIETPLGAISRKIGSKERYQTDLRLVMPLFTGGRIGGAVNSAGAWLRYREALAATTTDRVFYLARVAFLSVVAADRTVEAAKTSRQRADVICRDIQSLYDAGAADSVDLLEVDLTVTDAIFRLDEARHNRREAEIGLAQLLGLPLSESLQPAITVPTPSPPDSTAYPLIRPELAAAEAAVDLGQAQVQLATAGYFPSLSVFGGYSYGKPNIDQFNNTWNDYFSVGGQLTWSFNLGRQTSHNVRRAQHAFRAARHGRDDVAEQLTREERLADENLRLAFDRYVTAKRRHEITAANYRLAGARHHEGVLSSNRLLEIETALTEAEATLATAEAGFFIAQSTWYYAIGSDKLTKGL